MKLMTIDGNSIVNRAFYGIRELSASDGTPTNAIFGFLTILQRLLEDESPDALCVTFDMREPTFRHKMFEGYKAHRTGMPDELAVQMPILKDVLDALNIPRYELAGWEADDLLGTISQKCDEEKWECVIVTGDKDALQLVSEHTRVKHVKSRMGRTETIDYTTAAFIEEYGFEPLKMIDFKALMGDSSDNIPGVKGVGEKTASELVRRFGGIARIYDILDESGSGADGNVITDIKDTVRNKLLAGRESAEMSYTLAMIRRDVPLEFDLRDNLRRDYDNDKAFAIFKRLNFARLIEKFKLRPPTRTEFIVRTLPKPEIIEITTSEQGALLLETAKKAQHIAVHINTEYFDRAAAALPGEHKAYILRKGSTEGFDELLRELLCGDISKIGHNVKELYRDCLMRGIESSGFVFDTALAAYLIEPTEGNYSVKRISERYCGFVPSDEPTEESGQISLLGDSDDALGYEAYALAQLKPVLETKLNELELDKLFYQIEMPLCLVLAKMEHFGFLVDRDALLQFGETLGGLISTAENEIFEYAGEVFNVNSPKQLGVILFEKLLLPAPKKTKTGWSTSIDVLENLSGKHPIIEPIKRFRELSKLKSTYTDGLVKVIGKDGRIHTRFMMTVTATGRLSSTEPNLQNIPVRKQMGEELRKMFIAGDGNVLVDADYSQIELRLLAHIANDTIMLEAFARGEDIHTVTASQVFGVPLAEVTHSMRSNAKAVNFGIVYGISPFSLAHDIGVMPKDAKVYIDSYLEKYSGVRKYMADIVAAAKKDGYVSTLFGRRRNLPELKSSNFNIRSFGERVALNMPIQGTAADIMKIAMINVDSRLKAENLEARLILQVHDELLVECPEHEAQRVSVILQEVMETAATLNVPLIAETRAGKSWYEAK